MRYMFGIAFDVRIRGVIVLGYSLVIVNAFVETSRNSRESKATASRGELWVGVETRLLGA